MQALVKPIGFNVHIGKNASADSFYDSQGALRIRPTVVGSTGCYCWTNSASTRVYAISEIVIKSFFIIAVAALVFWCCRGTTISGIDHLDVVVTVAADRQCQFTQTISRCTLHLSVTRMCLQAASAQCLTTTTKTFCRYGAAVSSESDPIPAVIAVVLCVFVTLQRLHTVHPDTIGMEMETFQLMHLAKCSKGVIVACGAAIAVRDTTMCCSGVLLFLFAPGILDSSS